MAKQSGGIEAKAGEAENPQAFQASVADISRALAPSNDGPHGHQQGKYGEADDLFKRAMRIVKGGRDEKHPTMASIMSGQAFLLEMKVKSDSCRHFREFSNDSFFPNTGTTGNIVAK